MTKEEHKALITKYSTLHTNNLMAAGIILFLVSTFSVALYLSSSTSRILWFIGQVIFAINILQWFVILHDLGHGHFFSKPIVNIIFGHLASLFCILPFYPWKYIHNEHHIWTGWKDLDPTMSIVAKSERGQKQVNIVNFCWKNWVPIMTLSFSFSNFWNLAKLYRMFPAVKMKLKNTFSIALLIVCYGLFLYLTPLALFIKYWGIGYFLFLMISDPLLIGQHSGIDQYISSATDHQVKKIPLREQDDFTRSLTFPFMIGHFILLGFHKHSLHHIFPNLPGYKLLIIKDDLPNNENWLSWLLKAKKTPAQQLLFENIKPFNKD